MSVEYPRQLVPASYLLVLALIFFPVIDWFANAWPLSPAVVSWRYGAYGLMSGFILTPAMGLVLLVLLAGMRGHRTVLLISSIVAIIAALIVVLAGGVFVLDSIQLRSAADGGQSGRFMVGILKALLNNLGSAAIVLVAGIGALKLRKKKHGGGEAVLVKASGRTSTATAAPSEG